MPPAVERGPVLLRLVLIGWFLMRAAAAERRLAVVRERLSGRRVRDVAFPGEAIAHCTRGLGMWEWASNDHGEPDVVVACCGSILTLEALAAVDILRQRLPKLKVRFGNVVDLMRLQPDKEHANVLPDREFDTIFTVDRPVIFAYHGYPWLIHRLTHRRTNHPNLHVRGCKEEGTTTTPFGMVMLNDLDRFHMAMDVIDREPGLGFRAAALRQNLVDKRLAAGAYGRDHGQDPPVISDWIWQH